MGKIKEYKFKKKVNRKLNFIISILDELTEEVSKMSVELDALVVQVGETESVEDSVIALLQGIQAELAILQAELEAAQVDTTTLVSLRERLDASELALADAVATFTPPVPPEEPIP